MAEVIIVPKLGKELSRDEFYRPISLHPTIAKLFEKLFLERIKQLMVDRNLIPAHQFDFREKHFTDPQVHRIMNRIENAM